MDQDKLSELIQLARDNTPANQIELVITILEDAIMRLRSL